MGGGSAMHHGSMHGGVIMGGVVMGAGALGGSMHGGAMACGGSRAKIWQSAPKMVQNLSMLQEDGECPEEEEGNP